MSAMKAVPCSINIHAPRCVISMGCGVESGSMLVPEELCCSSVSIRVFGAAIPGIFIPGIAAIGWADAAGMGIVIPGISGMDC